jgi:hypothetical protein
LKNRKIFRSKVGNCKNFWRESFPAVFFLVRNLKVPKKFRTKTKIAGKNLELMNAEQEKCDWPVHAYAPPCAIPAPAGARAIPWILPAFRPAPGTGNTELSQGGGHSGGGEAPWSVS